MKMDSNMPDEVKEGASDSQDLQTEALTAQELELIAGGNVTSFLPCPAGCPPGYVCNPRVGDCVPQHH